MSHWLETTTFLNIDVEQWLLCLAAIIISYLVIRSAWKLLICRLTKIFALTTNQIDDLLLEILKDTKSLTFVMVSLLIGVQFLDIPARWTERINHLWFLVVGIQLALWLSKAVTLWSLGRLNKHGLHEENPVITTMMAWMLKVLFWSILLLAILSNMGVNITAFVASLGIGGVAVALAVQNILSDLFASLSIGLDKPFEIGDFVVFGNVSGTIELVGIKTTRIRSIDGEQIVCSNTELLKNTIHYYKRMATRRVVFGFGVTYDTPPEKLKEIPGMVKNIVEGAGDLRFDRAHFKAFGDSALTFEVVYILNTSDFNVYMDTQQAINLQLMIEFRSRQIEFAFPTITLDFSKVAAQGNLQSASQATQAH
ncbi:MAG TPA: mechanosensitive ion channel family protein [Methylophilaceae bacterium]|nr:mechanosensitive ion channel family protein [Methylophilaceae bacterium]